MQERGGEAGRLRPGHRGAGGAAGLVWWVDYTHMPGHTLTNAHTHTHTHTHRDPQAETERQR